MTPRAKPLVLMLISGDPARIHMALMTAAAAAASNRRTTLFVSKAAIPLFLKNGWEQKGGDAYDTSIESTGVADFSVLADALRSLNLRTILCDAGLAEHKADIIDADPRFYAELGGLVGLLSDNPDANWLTF